MTYIINNPKLSSVINKIELQKQYEIGIDCDIRQVEGFIEHTSLDFEAVEIPGGMFLGISEFGTFYVYRETDTFQQWCQKPVYELSLSRKEEAMRFIIDRLEDILEDM